MNIPSFKNSDRRGFSLFYQQPAQLAITSLPAEQGIPRITRRFFPGGRDGQPDTDFQRIRFLTLIHAHFILAGGMPITCSPIRYIPMRSNNSSMRILYIPIGAVD